MDPTPSISYIANHLQHAILGTRHAILCRFCVRMNTKVVRVSGAILATADSFVGRWFRLEGSGHPKQRIGSRYTVPRTSGGPFADNMGGSTKRKWSQV
ncbi:hypothetical protein DFH09DRAFT_533882 [Mycena vulgaris]|nr:hypothetical protein DFH09DRAFT_533882 [Mycena vulgaris]